VTFIACTQEHILRDECTECGGWLHAERREGFPGPSGNYCTEECAASAQERSEQVDVANHLRIRDLLCACAQVCAPAGHPTAEEIAEYEDYRLENNHGS
jgi:uracil-DNA glycosylase